MILQQARSGLSVRDWGRRHGLSHPSFGVRLPSRICASGWWSLMMARHERVGFCFGSLAAVVGRSSGERLVRGRALSAGRGDGL
jgi:hypothetical protein